MPRKPQRAVPEGERRSAPPSLVEAVESGDVLDMLVAQRRMIAEAMTTAADNTRPQLNNELNKLHALIREEQSRRDRVHDEKVGGVRIDGTFDASAI